MLALQIAFGMVAALRAVLVYGEAGPMQEDGWAHGRAERIMQSLRPVRGTRPAWHTANP